MNHYTKTIVKELSQICDFSVINRIREIELNGKALPDLEIDEVCISEIWSAWDNAKVFYIDQERHTCTRSYIREVLLRYCQNRDDMINNVYI